MSRRWVRSISLRSGLILAMASVVVFLGGAVQLTTLLGTQRAVRSLSRNLVDGAMARAEAQLVEVMNPERIMGLVTDWAEAGLLAPTEAEDARPLLESLLRRNPLLVAARVADERGNEIVLVRDADIMRLHQTMPEEWGDESRTLEWDLTAAGASQPRSAREPRSYDVRSQNWYQGAIEQLDRGGGVFATDPYPISASGEYGVTSSIAVSSSAGGRVVVAFDILFEQVQLFVENLEVSENGSVVILTDEGRLVAVPSRALPPGLEMRDWIFRFPPEIESPLLRAASDAYTTGTQELGLQRSFRSGREIWWGQVRPVEVPGRTLIVVVLLPQSDLLTDRAEIQRRMLTVTLGGLALALLAAVLLGRRFSRPIEALVRNSDRISTGDFDQGEAVGAAFTEIESLVDAQDRMRMGLSSLVKLEKDLEVARQIQRSTLPEHLPTLVGWEFAASNQPADETGGDTYDAFGLDSNWALPAEDAPSNRAVFLLADATGHGIGPALSVAQLRGMLRGAVHDADLATMVSKLNDQLVADLPSNRFITAWVGALAEDSGRLVYVSAGQAPLLHYRHATGEALNLKASSPPLGMFAGLHMEMPPAIELQHGDYFVVLSDGYFEAVSPDGEELGTERVIEVIKNQAGRSADEILHAIQGALERFTAGAPADDDRTAIVLKRL